MSKTIQLTNDELAFLIGELSATHYEQEKIYSHYWADLAKMEAENSDNVIGSIYHDKTKEAVNISGDKLFHATELLAKLTN